MNSEIIETTSFKYKKLLNAKSIQHVNLAMEIIIVLNGELNVNINEKSYLLKENSAIYLTPFETRILSTPNYSECYVITFSNENIKIFNEIFLNYLPYPRQITLDKQVINWIEYKLGSNKQLDELETFSILYPLFYEFKNNCTKKEDKLTFKDFFYDALKVINFNLSQEISLSSVAKEIGVHPVTLSKAFKKYSGMNFVEYVNFQRISYVKKEILNGKKSINIAFDAGFGSVRSFNRTFKKYFGCSPIEYKKMNYNKKTH